MSWYVSIDGRQVWVERDETVYTLGDTPVAKDLPKQELSYLATATKQAIYTEHMVDDDLGGKRGKAKEKQSGRQRGFVVRMDCVEARTKVNSSAQGIVDRLFDTGTISRLDIDESEKPKSRRSKAEKKEHAEKEKAAKEKEAATEEVPAEVEAPLGPNECRVELKARIQHFAHGKGFLVVVSEDGARQRLHVFTTDQELPVAEFHRRLLEAVQHTGRRAALGHMQTQDPPPTKRDEKKQEDDDWLSSVMGRCMVAKPVKPAPSRPAEGAGDGDGGPAGDGANASPGGDAADTAPKAKAKTVPPWLRR